jgi:Fe2+ or Zn2+ uptake regulation protein
MVRMRASGEYTISDLKEMFSIGRATVYRVLDRAAAAIAGDGS